MNPQEAFKTIIDQISGIEGASISGSEYLDDHFGDFYVQYWRGGEASALVNERFCLILYPNHTFEDGVVLVEHFQGMSQQELLEAVATAL